MIATIANALTPNEQCANGHSIGSCGDEPSVSVSMTTMILYSSSWHAARLVGRGASWKVGVNKAHDREKARIEMQEVHDQSGQWKGYLWEGFA